MAFSSGACAAIARKLLQGLGYVPTVEAGFALTLGLMGFFAAVQLAYIAFTRLVAPSRGTAPLLFETLSNAAAVTFVPYLAGVSCIPLLKKAVGSAGAGLVDKVTEKLSEGMLEPALLAGIFVTAHCAFKLIALFAATESRPAGRWPVLTWATAAAACALAGLAPMQRWAAQLDAGRLVALEAPAPVAVDGAYANARQLPLGVDMVVPLEGHATQRFTMLWALARDYDFPPTQIHVTVALDGETPYEKVVDVSRRGWAEFRPFLDPIAEKHTSCRISWDFAPQSALALKLGLRTPPSARDAVWVAGPYFAAPVEGKTAPSFVILGVDGMASSRMKSQKYSRDTMPVIENLAKSSIYFPTCVTPAPEARAAYMTLLTGLSPLAHGYLGKRPGPLPADAPVFAERLQAQQYVTAAFTESEWIGAPDLGFDTDFKRGFDYFDPTTPLEAGARGSLPGAPTAPQHAGSAETLAKAADWAEAHAGDRFLLFVRLREAGAPAALARYGEGFIADRSRPDPDDVYDTALSAVDKALPVFLDRLKARGLMDSTVIVIASPFGLEPWRDTGLHAALSDATTMTPLLILDPAKTKKARNTIISLADVAPTLLHMLTPSLAEAGATDLREYSTESEAVSLTGDPLVLSLRNRRWRFTWSSGLDPFTRDVKSGEAAMELINIEQSRARGALIDDLSRFPDEAARAREALLKFLGGNKLPGQE